MFKNCFLLFVLFSFAGLLYGQSKPKIYFPQKEINIGKIKSGEVLDEIEFWILNKGDSPLNIKKIKSSCSCLWADKIEDSIEPGDSTIINAHFYSEGGMGAMSKSLSVYSNDPKDSIVTISIKGEVEVFSGKIIFREYPSLQKMPTEFNHRPITHPDREGWEIYQVENADTFPFELFLAECNDVSSEIYVACFSPDAKIPDESTLAKGWDKIYTDKKILKPKEKTWILVNYNRHVPGNGCHGDRIDLWVNDYALPIVFDR